MSLLYETNRWTIKHPQEDGGRYVTLDPDGNEQETFDDYSAAWRSIAPKNTRLLEAEMDERGRDLADLLVELKARGVSEISVEYNGCGDEGQLGQVTVTGAEATAAEIGSLEIYFEYVLEARYEGWMNNDGAEGTFSIDLTASVMKVKHVHNACYTAHDTTEHENELRPHPSEGESSEAARKEG